MDLSKKTVKQLREFADENFVELGNAKTKKEILAVLETVNLEDDSDKEVSEYAVVKQNVITMPEKEKVETKPLPNNVIGSPEVVEPEPANAAPPVNNKVLVKSERNLYIIGVANIKVGYNVVHYDIVDQVTKYDGIRRATREEAAEAAKSMGIVGR